MTSPLATEINEVALVSGSFVLRSGARRHRGARRRAYGTQRLAEGTEVEGRRVLMVEDVVTTAGQIVLSTRDLRALGADVRAAVCVIDREAGGREALAEIGVELRPLFGRADLG